MIRHLAVVLAPLQSTADRTMLFFTWKLRAAIGQELNVGGRGFCS